MGRCRWPVVPAEASCNPPLCMGDARAASTGRSGGARGRFPGAARAQAAPLHEPERRQAPPFGGMSGGRAFQIGPAHEGGGPGRGNPPDVEVFRLGNSGTIVSLWHFCISFSDAYTEGRGVTAWRRSIRRGPGYDSPTCAEPTSPSTSAPSVSSTLEISPVAVGVAVVLPCGLTDGSENPPSCSISFPLNTRDGSTTGFTLRPIRKSEPRRCSGAWWWKREKWRARHAPILKA